MENLVIEIGTDTKDFIAGLAQVGDSTDDLGDKLKGIGEAASVAFAGISASILGSVYAYREEEQANLSVNAIIEATGGIAGVSAQSVQQYAESLEQSTTFSKTQIEQGESMLLTFNRIGTDTFPQATKAMLDLAEGMGTSTQSAATLLGRALQDPITGTTMLTRAGITLTGVQKAQIQSMVMTGNTARAQAIILKEIETRFGGLSMAAAGGTGAFLQLKNSMEDMAERIGAEFAPALIAMAQKIKEIVDAAADNEPLMKFIATGAAIAAGITGVVAAITGAVVVFNQFATAAGTVATVLDAVGISARGVAGATGIGLILVVAGELYEHWNDVWPAMQNVFNAFVSNIASLAGGVGKILKGIFTFDTASIKQGVDEAVKAMKDGFTQATGGGLKAPVVVDKASAEQAGRDTASIENAAHQKQIIADQDAANKEMLAAQQAAEQAKLLQLSGFSQQTVALYQKEAELRKQIADQSYQGDKGALQTQLSQILQMESAAGFQEAKLQDDKNTLVQLQASNSSKALIDIKKQEIADRQKLMASSDAAEQQALQTHLAQLEKQYDLQNKKDLAAKAKFDNMYQSDQKTFQNAQLINQAQFKQNHETQLTGMMEDEESAAETAYAQQLQQEIQADNKFLEEKAKYGAAYAEIDRITHSAIITGTASAFSELTQMTQSQNETLKAIGKAASVANIVIKTAESAESIYAGFATIPIVGPALGIAGAAAAVAFGAEQLQTVMSAAEGGLMTGGIPGVDSIPTLTMPGELVVPSKNFDEVINSVAGNRYGSEQGQQAQQTQVRVTIELKGNASRMLQVKAVQDQALGVYRGT